MMGLIKKIPPFTLISPADQKSYYLLKKFSHL